ncbi:PTS sugar transporter subunit IIB [Heyndrickxia coagulans]|uniref:PTS system, cellobiose-specific IIB component n=1 Tax=Heyndrickxia coagulans TaxID=1398 RepID=A0A150K4F6_HEYCO|nr:PTS sugar transporter subunit IIB [Heyndrickxia coagulans]KYC64495.1 PTS system, cellobiose-specific IIB component [Heyndrickxia coagulans]
MAEKTIMLVCNAGMSTSMLVTKMKEVAVADKKDYEIFAVSTSKVPEMVANKHIDAILLGPQVRYMASKVKDQAKGIPLEVINMTDYGTMNGKNVIAQAERLF